MRRFLWPYALSLQELVAQSDDKARGLALRLSELVRQELAETEEKIQALTVSAIQSIELKIEELEVKRQALEEQAALVQEICTVGQERNTLAQDSTQEFLSDIDAIRKEGSNLLSVIEQRAASLDDVKQATAEAEEAIEKVAA